MTNNDPPPRTENQKSLVKSPDSPNVPAQTDKLVENIEREAGPLIPATARKQVLAKVTAIVRRESYFRGPLPPPDMLAGYEAALPGAADRIIKMAEVSLDHDCNINTQAQKDDRDDRTLGMKLGFAALCVLTVAAAACALMGHELFGGGLVLAGVAGVIARFIHGRSTASPASEQSAPEKD